MRNIYLLLFNILFSLLSFAQEKENTVKFSTRTPRNTIETFQAYLSNNNYDTEKVSYILDGPYSQEKKSSLVVSLKSLLKRYGQLDIEEIPDKRRYRNSDDEFKYILYPKHSQVYLERVRGKWLFSEETVSKIDQLYHIELRKNYKRNSKDVLPKTNKIDSLIGKFSMKTPYQTIYSHILFVQDSTFRPEYLEQLINTDKSASKAERVEKAIKIFQFYLGANERWIHIEDVPDEPNYIDTLSGKHIFIINPKVPELFLEKVGKNWKYSLTTSEMIEEMHEAVYPIGADAVFSFGTYFKNLVGSNYGSKVLFDMKLYQVVMLLFFIVVFILFFLIMRFIIRLLIFKIFRDKSLATIYYKVTVALFLVIYSVWNLIFIPAIQLPGDVHFVLKKILVTLYVISLTNLSLHLTDIWFRFMTRNEPIDTMTAKKGAYTFAVAIIKGILIIIGAFFFVEKLGYNVTGLLTGISIGGFAVALGAQETIKNFFGSIMIFLDKPFQVGDWVSVEKEEGIVEEVGLRTTKIRTFYNSLVIIPNSQVANITIDNFEKRNFRRYKTYFKFPLDVDVEKLEELIKSMEELVKQHPNTRKDFFQIKVNSIGMYSIDILFYVFFRVPNWSTELESRHELIMSVMKLAKEHGIKFALPPNVSV
ncbi:MAG: mechanosensitive ion channel family protein [Flavobacteriales bacterium]|nr:mechanosensitive ion channel family protein [Flavobacteriales bacterium]